MQSFISRLALVSLMVLLCSCALLSRKNNENANLQENLSAAEQMMKENKFVEALETLDKLDYPQLDEKRKYLYACLKLKAAHKAERYEYFRWRGAAILLGTEYAGEIDAVIDEMRKSENPLARWHAYNFLIRTMGNLKEQKEIVLEVLRDPNPVLRYYALTWIDMRQDTRGLEDLESELERISRDDPDPMNRAFAGQAIRRKKSSVPREDQPPPR